jgi:hypothetical protein
MRTHEGANRIVECSCETAGGGIVPVKCTNMYLSGFPAEELMRISGHKSPAAFMRYIKVDNQQAANRLKELRNSMNKAK